MIKAIQVKLVMGSDTESAHMIASCIGERAIQCKLINLPRKRPAYALAMLLCHRNKWPDNLVYGLLPNGDEVFCFSTRVKEVTQR